MISFQHFNELAYDKNVGIHELMQFYDPENGATQEQIQHLQYLMEIGDTQGVIKLIQKVTGTKLVVPTA